MMTEETKIPAFEGPIDDQIVHLARNALLVAGMEMGAEGDHWPVIKANIHALMHDYEQLKIERAVQDELREHVGKLIGEYEAALDQCDPVTRAKAEPHVRQMREIHEAMFAPVDPKNLGVETEEEESNQGEYVPWKSSRAIIEALMEENHEEA